MIPDCRIIFHASRDIWLMHVYPNLAEAVRAWLKWYENPTGVPPIDTIELGAACAYMITRWPYMYSAEEWITDDDGFQYLAKR